MSSPIQGKSPREVFDGALWEFVQEIVMSYDENCLPKVDGVASMVSYQELLDRIEAAYGRRNTG